jgi:hypothetical protein
MNSRFEWSSSPIGELIFLHESNSTNRQNFENEILRFMKAGRTGQGNFTWTRQDGSQQQMCLSYAPVIVNVMLGMSPDDFSVGVNMSTSLVYSVAVGKPCHEFQKPFDAVEEYIDQALRSIMVIYLVMNVASTLCFIIFAAIVAACIGEWGRRWIGRLIFICGVCLISVCASGESSFAHDKIVIHSN